MNLFILLCVIDRTQYVRVIDNETFEIIYEGSKFNSPCVGMDVVNVYASESEMIIEVKVKRSI